jgi:DNA polymerase (family 10)
VLSEIMKIQGLGPKRVQVLHRALKIRSVADLERAAASGRIRKLPGFGARTERIVLDGIRRLARRGRRFKLNVAEEIAKPLIEYLEGCKGVKQITIAGSFRRRRETVGDLDVLVTAARGATVTEWFVAYDEVREVISRGSTRAAVRLSSGLHVDLRVVPQVSYGAALHYFTGSKAHNIAVRTLGAKKGCKINEYGVFRDNRRIAGKTEPEVFSKVGLDYIPPELREDQGEIEAARRHWLPKLIGIEDICGDLHCHTSASDGHASIEKMATAAADLGYEYLSINDHSRHVTIANGLDEKRVFAQIKAIDKLNAKLKGLTVLKSIEVDILEDGSLDLPNRVLKELDFTVCAIHYQFGLSEKRQTERILRAMDNPYFTILAHPTGRLINERAPYLVDLGRVLERAKKQRCYLEVNAHPDRLDLTDQACRLAKEIGVMVAISTDAHSPGGLGFMRYGIDQARRGWLTADDVVNSRGIAQLRSLLERH